MKPISLQPTESLDPPHREQPPLHRRPRLGVHASQLISHIKIRLHAPKLNPRRSMSTENTIICLVTDLCAGRAPKPRRHPTRINNARTWPAPADYARHPRPPQAWQLKEDEQLVARSSLVASPIKTAGIDSRSEQPLSADS